MIPQSKIFTKLSQTPVVVGYEAAKKIDEAWNNPSVDGETVLKVGSSMSFRKNQIRGVMVFRDGAENTTKHAEEARAFYEKERVARAAFLANPERHHDLALFEFVCGFNKVEMTPQVRERAVDIQRNFFHRHPRRCYVDLSEFKEIIPRPMSGLLPDAGWRIAGNVIARDAQLAGKNA